MALITFKKQHKAETRFDFLDEDDDGMVTSTTSIETTGILAEGDISTVHLCDYNGIPSVVKILRNKIDSDLAANEASVLTELCPEGKWGEKFFRYLPQLLHSDTCDDLGTINIFPYYSEWVSLADVIAAFPDGLDFRDAVWMYKRAIIAIGFAHENDFVHGAIIPDHILIHPDNHGGKILDWSYAKKTHTGHIPAISTPNQAYYPPEVFDRKPVTNTIDIFMVTKVMIRLLGGDLKTNEMPDTVPPTLQEALRRCVHLDLKRRPQNAWNFHKELDEVLRAAVGPRVFRPFKMP